MSQPSTGSAFTGSPECLALYCMGAVAAAHTPSQSAGRSMGEIVEREDG